MGSFFQFFFFTNMGTEKKNKPFSAPPAQRNQLITHIHSLTQHNNEWAERKKNVCLCSSSFPSLATNWITEKRPFSSSFFFSCLYGRFWCFDHHLISSLFFISSSCLFRHKKDKVLFVYCRCDQLYFFSLYSSYFLIPGVLYIYISRHFCQQCWNQILHSCSFSFS